MVDAYFLLNGGDRDSAVKVARAYLDSEYVETKVGAGSRGKRRFRNVPEAVYGPHCGHFINGKLEEMGPGIEERSGIPFDRKHALLVATPETDRLVELGQDPVWLLARANDDGTSQFYYDRGTQLPITISFGGDEIGEMFIDEVIARETPGKVISELPILAPYVKIFTGGTSGSMRDELQQSPGARASIRSMDKALKGVAVTVVNLFRHIWSGVVKRKRAEMLSRTDLVPEMPSKATKEIRQKIEERKEAARAAR
jgi:hypothetical protein